MHCECNMGPEVQCENNGEQEIIDIKPCEPVLPSVKCKPLVKNYTL